MIDPRITRICFNVRCFTNLDEQVYVVGDHPVLGDWDAMNAIKMKTGRDSYPIWSVDVELPRGTKLEYKFIKRLTKPTGDTEVTWEAL